MVARPTRQRSTRPRRRHLGLLLAAALLAAGSPAAATGLARRTRTPAPGWPYTATVTASNVPGLAVGRTRNLIHLVDLTLEGLGATVVGRATLHVNVARSPYACLNGSAINVFGYDGRYFLHNGLQGAQCTRGTWEVAPASITSPARAPFISRAAVAFAPIMRPPAPLARLYLAGRNLGSSPGAVSLIGSTATASGPVVATSVTSWAPARVVAGLRSQVTLGHPYDVLLLTNAGAAASIVVRIPRIVPLVAAPRVAASTSPRTTAAESPRGGARACPWSNPPPDEGPAAVAAQVVSHMTLAEELDVVTLRSAKAYENTTTAVPALCIPALTLEDGPDGLAYKDRGVTQFPAALDLAATFDPRLVAAEGRSLGEEARAQGIEAVQGPLLNLARVPQGGRVFEGYGEDPDLAGTMGTADVLGLQSAGVLADVKDLGAYTQETERDFLDQRVSEQALQELYLAPFRSAVRNAEPASIMCGFGDINGVQTCADPALFSDLASWGFTGFVRDDINGAPNGAAALAAGLDLFKPTPFAGPAGLRLATSEQPAIAAAARRVLAQMSRFGLLRHPPGGSPGTPVQTATAKVVAAQVAEEGAVLLQNRDATLPLPPATPSIAVVGAPAAERPISSGRGSSAVASTSVVAPLPAIAAKWPHAAVTYAPGEPAAPPAAEIAPPEVTPALPDPPPPRRHPIYHTGSPPTGTWRTWQGTLRAPVAGLYELFVASHGDTEVTLDGKVLLDDPGTHGPVTDDLAYPFVAGRPYRLTLRWFDYDGHVPRVSWEDATPLVAAAARAAKTSSVAVVVVGDVRTEGADDPSLALPGVQDALVGAVAAANPRTVVVVETGGAVLMPWLAKVAAVLEDWYPGQADGTALAAVLSGAVDPSGHLPVTFPRSAATTSVPSAASWPGVNDTVNLDAAGGGGLDVGYRYYQAHKIPVLFPFGYGLSYTTFALSGLEATPRPGGGTTVTVEVANTGAVPGRAVVQAYVHYPAAAHQPPLALQGFAAASLRPGERTPVTVDLPPAAFQTWQRGRFTTVPGTYEIDVGTSSASLPLSVALRRR